MKGIFKKTLSALFDRKKKLPEAKPDYWIDSVAKRPNANPLNSTQSENKDVAREHAHNYQLEEENSERILNYWLDSELFDIPECPIYNQRDLLSIPVDDFEEVLSGSLKEKIKQKKVNLTKDSRILIMFQCHRAGYISKDSDKHPNEEIPRTFLAAQALIPTWSEDLDDFIWNRSEDEEDIIINLASMRTLYRRCPPPSTANMNLSDWVEARLEIIENMLHRGFEWEDDETPLTTILLKDRINSLNRKIAQEFWPDEKSRQFMLQQCQSIESQYQEESVKNVSDEKKYAPLIKKNGDVTFRWRFCFYPEASEKNQLGPFFVKDLENAIRSIGKEGLDGISLPLQRYLLSNKEQTEIGQATNNGKFFLKLTNKKVLGRWPENPNFGLSLLQTVAVNVAMDKHKNPIVAVNGPPGTGKTTLLKDIIAWSFVSRTVNLLKFVDKGDWLENKSAIQEVLRYSTVVASSNNKAVENISKELPSLSKINELYQGQISHFSDIADDGNWGLFCAVLGNSVNRSEFKSQLKKLKGHLKNASNVLHLNQFKNKIFNAEKVESGQIVKTYIEELLNEKKLHLLSADIKDSHAAKNKHAHFLIPFAAALDRIKSGELSIEQLAETWSNFSDEQWEQAKEAIDAFKRQWFGAKKGQAYLEEKLKLVKGEFEQKHSMLHRTDYSDPAWEACGEEFLSEEWHYDNDKNEPVEETESKIQQKSPFGSRKLNDARTNLFIHALKLNEAMLDVSADKLVNAIDEISLLVDGRLETNEKVPEHKSLWAKLFLFFPVISTSLSSVENQFKLMQKPGCFGMAMFDEAGQAVNYHVVGLLNRVQQAIFVGDPIQLEPVVGTPQSVDLAIAEDFLDVSRKDDEKKWGDQYLVSKGSAQSIADNAGVYFSAIGQRKVGIPLLVHRRCTEPMFTISNRIAYDEKMVCASKPFDWKGIQSGWINVTETTEEINKRGYYNQKEAKTAIQMLQFMAVSCPQMLKNGAFIITPFTAMQREIRYQWSQMVKDPANHSWMMQLFDEESVGKEPEHFAWENVGTVHTFQGKEASTVILCCSASEVRNKTGGISWVNSKPNLINVAVTRAKHHLFVLGNSEDWSDGQLSSELMSDGMRFYKDLEDWKSENSKHYQEMSFVGNINKGGGKRAVFTF